jgi:ubiquinone/menaquinone biosynthesis C-methylase UbiE
MPYDRDVQAFDERAASYESGRHGRLHKEISDRVVELSLSRVPAPRRVLDVGCGTGYVLRQLAARLPQASEFLGVDAAPKMIEAARSASSDERLNFVRGTAERLPAGDSAYDLVVSTTSFGQVPLCLLEFLLRAAQEPRRGDLGAVVHHSEVPQAEVDAALGIRLRQRLR